MVEMEAPQVIHSAPLLHGLQTHWLLNLTRWATQEVVRAVIGLGGAAVSRGALGPDTLASLGRYLAELRSPCTCSDWCINVVKDDKHKHNLVFFHPETQMHLALHPGSEGSFAIHSPSANATTIDKDGAAQYADSAVLFCRFRQLVCRTPLPEGRYLFGNWTIVCKPKLFTCLEVHHSALAGTRFKIAMSQKGSSTFSNVSGQGSLLSQ
jgi:hypothetical protein